MPYLWLSGVNLCFTLVGRISLDIANEIPNFRCDYWVHPSVRDKRMDTFIRRPTKTTPYVHLDADTGLFVIAGRSIPIDADAFYRPVLEWVDELLLNPPKKIQFTFRFDFFNIASSKRILFLLYKLVEVQGKGTQATVRWMYDKADEDMLEIGKDYDCMIETLSFDFERYDVSELNKSRILKLG